MAGPVRDADPTLDPTQHPTPQGVGGGGIPVPGFPVQPTPGGEAGSPRIDRLREGGGPRRLKLRHHVEGSIEPWSQLPDSSEIVPLDLTAPAPAADHAPDASDAEGLLAAVEHLRDQAELGSMTSAICREVLNPLAGIGATAEVLRTAFDAGDPRAEGVEAILEEVARLDRLMHTLLDLTRCRSPRPLAADIADDVECVVRTVAAEAKRAAVAVAVEAPEACTPVLVDSALVQQAFLHLASNAIQAMPRGGTLAIRARTPEVASRFVCVEFADTGVGIASDDLPFIFEPFFTTRADGVGLGLAAVRRLIEAQGGHVTVESAAGDGSCFTVYLPRADQARS